MEGSTELLPALGEVCLPPCALVSCLTHHLASLFKLKRYCLLLLKCLQEWKPLNKNKATSTHSK